MMSNERWYIFGVIMALLFVANSAAAATFTEQPDPFSPDQMQDVDRPQTIFGALRDFPHTYTFTLAAPTTVTYQLGVPVGGAPVSFLLVKQANRGVQEVARVSADTVVWQPRYDWSIARRVAFAPVIELSLDSGVYKLEVSNPANDGYYQLEVNGGAQPGFLASLVDTFQVHAFYGSWVTALLSWQVVVLLLIVLLAYWWLRRVLS